MQSEPNNQNAEGSGTTENCSLIARLADSFGPVEKTEPRMPSLSPSKT